MNQILKYMYIVNYPTFEEELCLLEMRAVFGKMPVEKTLFSNIEFNSSNSPFIKTRLDIIYEKDTIEELLVEINKDKRIYNNFKLEYIRLNNNHNIPYEERLDLIKKLSMNIIGTHNFKNPEFNFGVTKVDGKWLFGIDNKNDYKWHTHDNKPCSYSNSLGVKVAKAVVNIANNGLKENTIIDPCCGVGTTLVEALDAGYQIEGYEINKHIAKNANINLEFYGFKPIVINDDMHNIKKNYDSSIIDIPYGLFSHTSEEEQQDIINTARRISNRIVLISFEEHDLMVAKAGFKIIDRCVVTKGKFKRFIVVAE
ncbi:SAM-dependent methyltransferase [Cetobacterium somerae]|uniref:TRM11 family SAM-dependent methyltransferase n=1 Tax=Cetobacterium somerae TaxID=188913 RepID=UPI00211ECE75|nr:SAM-dependent methyltransferase [Cetobacterium somerae]MCQ9627300.1 SAM-dependent methyltransferase [Cetobacterium somerae]